MKMNYKEFVEMLNGEEFATKTYETTEKNSDFQKVHDYDVIDLFDELSEQFGRVPTQTEYIESGVERAKSFFSNPVYIFKERKTKQFEWNSNLIACVKERLSNTYRSYLIEVQVELFIRENCKMKTKTSSALDLTFGADIVVLDSEKQGLWYLHVASNSKWSKRMIDEKGSRKPYIPKNGFKHYWNREWNKYNKPHQLLLYNRTLSDRMQELNGNLIFNDAYLKLYFDKLFASNDHDKVGNSEFEEFMIWMRNNKLD